MIKKYLMISILSSLVLFCNNCNSKKEIPKTDVLVSISPQKYFIDRISGETVTVHVISPVRQDPYSVTITEHEKKQINSSYVYFMIGNVSFEKQIISLISKTNPDIKIINLSGSIDQDDETANNINKKDDEFIWLSPKPVKEMLAIITGTLCEKNPRFSDVYEKNMKDFIREIDNFDHSAKAIFRDTIHRKFLTSKPYWSHFAHHYRLTQIPLNHSGMHDDKTKKRLIKRIRKKRIKAIITSTYPEASIPADITDKINSRTFQVNPFDYDWIDNMYAIVSTFKDALNYQ